MATKKKKAGRPKVAEKVKTKYIYITDSKEREIKKGFKSLTVAILAKCG